MLQLWMSCCPWDQIWANSKENFLEMCLVWTAVHRSALKTGPKWPQISIILELCCFCLYQLYQRPKWQYTKFLKFQSNYWKKWFANHDPNWQFFLSKVFSSVMLHSLGAGGVFLYLLMKQYLQSCMLLFIFFVLLQYPAVVVFWVLEVCLNKVETNKNSSKL